MSPTGREIQIKAATVTAAIRREYNQYMSKHTAGTRFSAFSAVPERFVAVDLLLTKYRPEFVPAHAAAFGKGKIEFYSRAEVQRLIDSTLKKRAERVTNKPTLPAPAATAVGSEAQFKMLAMRLDTVDVAIKEAQSILFEKMTAQNRVLHGVLEKQGTQIAELLKQLGVKEIS
jgi:hypothetical protein